MDNLKDILREEVAGYAGSGRGANIRLFAILDDERQTYAVNAVRHPEKNRPAGVVVLARIADDKIIIEEDRTDRPLADALIQRGVPRDQIILAYAGEPIPGIEKIWF